jgi:hypothetical protein
MQTQNTGCPKKLLGQSDIMLSVDIIAMSMERGRKKCGGVDCQVI